jgi:hypothetical protein
MNVKCYHVQQNTRILELLLSAVAATTGTLVVLWNKLGCACDKEEYHLQAHPQLDIYHQVGITEAL